MANKAEVDVEDECHLRRHKRQPRVEFLDQRKEKLPPLRRP